MLWEEIVAAARQRGWSPRQVFQEEIHKAVLAALSREKAFTSIVFRGGTALHLFYDNPRHSEDLDFVLHKKGQAYDLTAASAPVVAFVRQMFPFLDDVSIDIQKNDWALQRLVLRTQSQRLAQRHRIHLELAFVPAYRHRPRILTYPPLHPVVRVEEPSEIAADKATALALRPYLKGRDLWDLYYLTAEQGHPIPWNLAFQKAEDHGSTRAAFQAMLHKAAHKIRETGAAVLATELQRFLSPALLEHYQPLFPDIAGHAAELTEQASGEEDHEGR
ncbi:MAG: nucleotidyl transferase AbiEii/AbiGii toxin family protein [Candidatus Thermoplasmatota archaeon]|nr:nucleotidyl transferase AbiEii/AbiGii toxin family protein [Candidatus Thermoplasmatota archaeon]MDD5778693.1 nucleotidyl transferase AbiEii/AbiGii toxin family protein [Candidatus Thermoplasmatota archaeon]